MADEGGGGGVRGAPAGARPRSRLLDWLVRRARLGTPGRFSPFIVRSYRGWAGTLMKVLFRPQLAGLEHLPAGRPFLVVANHSGCGAGEVFVLLSLWVRAFGDARPVAGMAHPIAFSLPGVARLLREAGAIPSTYEAALGALGQGVPVLVFPGGDHDAFRPLWRAREVDWNGRQGFLRIARQARVPVVPMAIHGSHYTQPILWRSRLLPWLLLFPGLLGLKRFPLTLTAVAGAGAILGLVGPAHGYALAGLVAWLWASSPFAVLLPLVPWTVRVRIGAPLEPETLFGPAGAEEEAPLDGAYERVVGEVQRLLTSA